MDTLYWLGFGSFCIIGFYFLFRSTAYVKYTYDTSLSIPVTGPQLCLLFIFLTGILRFGYPNFAFGMDLSAIKLLYLIVLTGVGVIFGKTRRFKSWFVLLYLVYLVWLVVSIYLSPVKGYGVRVFLKYLFPFLIFLFAIRCKVDELVFLKYLDVLIKISFIYLLCYFLPVVDTFPSLFCTYATFSDYLTVIVMICLALYFHTKKRKYLIFMGLFLLFPIFASIRTGISATILGMSFFFIIKYKFKSVFYIFLAALAAFLIIIHTPVLRDKMFKTKLTDEDVSNLNIDFSLDNINTNARQAMWEWALLKYYEPNKITGSGLGRLQYAFYGPENPFRIRAVHNDFVQILCDSGLIGFVLFLSPFLLVIFHCIRIYHDDRNNDILKLSALISGSAYAAIMACSITNNTVNFSGTTYCYPFAFYGITLYLLRKRKTSSINE